MKTITNAEKSIIVLTFHRLSNLLAQPFNITIKSISGYWYVNRLSRDPISVL